MEKIAKVALSLSLSHGAVLQGDEASGGTAMPVGMLEKKEKWLNEKVKHAVKQLISSDAWLMQYIGTYVNYVWRV